MLREIVTATLAAEAELEWVEEPVEPGSLAAAVRASGAAFVVLGERAGAASGRFDELLYEMPRLRILALVDEGRSSYLHELRPRERALGELSPERLLEAVRGRS